jgi:hypothetical protein
MVSRIRRDSGGYIVVETIGAFVPFLLLVISIISLVNIAAVQARVHYALTQAANTLSMYCYTLEVTGVANEMTTLDNKANRVASEANAFRNDVGSVINGINSFSGIGGAAAGGGNAVSRAYSLAEQAAGDPKEALQLLMNFGLNELRGQVFELLARPLVGRYLANGGTSGDEYLRNAGVVNTNSGSRRAGLEALEFYQFRNMGLGNSVLIDRNGNVKLVVEYEIEYRFAGLPLPFGPTLKITQTVITKAWLNGSGRGYR